MISVNDKFLFLLFFASSEDIFFLELQLRTPGAISQILHGNYSPFAEICSQLNLQMTVFIYGYDM